MSRGVKDRTRRNSQHRLKWVRLARQESDLRLPCYQHGTLAAELRASKREGKLLEAFRDLNPVFVPKTKEPLTAPPRRIGTAARRGNDAGSLALPLSYAPMHGGDGTRTHNFEVSPMQCLCVSLSEPLKSVITTWKSTTGLNACKEGV
jgi:hypothetical protein